jgi:modulator of FtsH protease
MDAYSTANWAPVFSAAAGASAALTGLLFVALSINLTHVIQGPGLTGRAIEVLVLLTSALIISTLLLMPSQGADTVATEILTVAVLVEVLLIYIHVRAPRRVLGVSAANFAMRVFGAHIGPIFLIVGAISLFARSQGGLYWVVPALLAAMVAAIIGAWVMLVEIVR